MTWENKESTLEARIEALEREVAQLREENGMLRNQSKLSRVPGLSRERDLPWYQKSTYGDGNS